ncbi:MAG TPA: penicillin-binding protein 2 [Anaerolineaceae bacterium]|nr:penicillin-binding protein 2 [Anaerolineaceae bacterium]
MKNIPFTRFNIIGLGLSFLIVLIMLQMIRIETSAQGRALNDKAEKNYEYVKQRIYPERGNIYDRWGHLLAGNEEVYEVGVDLSDVQNPDTIAAVSASILGLDYNDVLHKASAKFVPGVSEYTILTDFVDPAKIDQIKQIEANFQNGPAAPQSRGDTTPSLSGLTWTPHLKRSYPENTVASNILGFVSWRSRDQAQGYFGVEEKFNDLLSGTPKDVVVPVDPNKIQDIPTVPPGASLVLTIDTEIQSMVETTLDRYVKSTGSVSGTVIVENPRNGEILAMATTPRLDPNQYWDYAKLFPGSTSYNRAVGTTYEPGSVFKVLTMGAALDAGVVKPDTPFLDTGSIEVGGITIYDWNRGSWGPQTMLTCMQNSLNVCLSWVAEQMGPKRFYAYLQAFGIGHKTNIDLGDEVIWPLSLPGDSDWYPANLGTNSFGQGVAVTPIQMVQAISAEANDGKMMAPHVLKSVIQNGRQYDTAPQVVGTPLTPQGAHTITNLLATSVEEEGSTAVVDGYRCAGKTGTAEIPTPYGYTISQTNASFVGWGPADDPQFLVYIWLEKPKTSIWGSIVAAPVFHDIVQQLVVLMNIPPDSIRQKLSSP